MTGGRAGLDECAVYFFQRSIVGGLEFGLARRTSSSVCESLSIFILHFLPLLVSFRQPS